MNHKKLIVKPIKATTIIKGTYAKSVVNDINLNITPSSRAIEKNNAALSLLNKLRDSH